MLTPLRERCGNTERSACHADLRPEAIVPSASAHRRVPWPDEVDEVLAGDLVVAVGSPTPRGGVVLNSVTPLGLRDRDAGTVTFTTSLGFGRKLERIAADPRIAVAYHTRRHGHSNRPGVVLVQGVASVRSDTSGKALEDLRQQAAAHIGQIASGRFWDWWLRVYYLDRVLVDVHVQRILWWPSGSLRDEPTVMGAPLPDQTPASQSPPHDAAKPRIPLRKLRSTIKKPHQLLGFLDADGMPVIVPITVTTRVGNGLVVVNETRLMPRGGRRAGFLAHDFRAKLIGLSTATHTGWLSVDQEALWTPHTRHAFAAPPNKTLLLIGNGAAARWGYWQALRHGRDAVVRHAHRVGSTEETSPPTVADTG
jgi:hypothetical protein